MSRIVLGCCCALIVCCVEDQPAAHAQYFGANPPSESHAQLFEQRRASDPRAARPQSESRVQQEAEKRIEGVLRQPLKSPLDFVEVPLDDVLSLLSDEYNLQIVLDTSALDEIAVSPDAEVTISARAISLDSALNLMFRQPGLQDLTHVVDDEVLLITTIEEADSTLQTRVYRVDDFDYIAPHSEREGTNQCSSLVEVIMGCVEFDSWKAHGTGFGQIHAMEPGVLVVVQTRRTHHQIAALISELREVRQAIERDARSSRQAGDF